VYHVWDWHPYADRFAIGGYTEAADELFPGETNSNGAIIMAYDSKVFSKGPRMISFIPTVQVKGADHNVIGVRAIQMQRSNQEPSGCDTCTLGILKTINQSGAYTATTVLFKQNFDTTRNS
jgi:hypothetical protein